MGVLENIGIRGIASAVPEEVEDNMEAVNILGERRCKKQIKLTGIERRYVSPNGQKMSDLCYVAGKRIMEHLSWQPDEIKVLVLLTQSSDFALPSTAFLLQKLLGIPEDCIVFDVNLGCPAFNVGLQIVSALLNQISGNAKGLCFQGDLAFRSINDSVSADIVASYMLFGSAASVTAVEKQKEIGVIPYATYSDGKRYYVINRSFGNTVNMDGEAVFNFSINDVAASINQFRKQYSLSDEKIDYYVFHQAQKLILDNLSMECNIPPEKELRSLKHYGNTSGASVPLTLCSNIDQLDKEQINVFSCGFGVGLSWSMAYTVLDARNILPVIYTNEILS